MFKGTSKQMTAASEILLSYVRSREDRVYLNLILEVERRLLKDTRVSQLEQQEKRQTEVKKTQQIIEKALHNIQCIYSKNFCAKKNCLFPLYVLLQLQFDFTPHLKEEKKREFLKHNSKKYPFKTKCLAKFYLQTFKKQAFQVPHKRKFNSYNFSSFI